MSKDLTIELEATNLGPFSHLNFSDKISSLQIGIFANNGSGKTFLSRAFRLLEKQPLSPEDSNRLLSLAKDKGYFKFRIINSKEPGILRNLEATFPRNDIPIFKNETTYLFHIFNSDYVRENIETLRYKPDGKIEGYILSKEKIDLTKEKQELAEMQKNLQVIDEGIQNKIIEARQDIDNLEVNKRTTEYTYLSLENLIEPSSLSESISFKELSKKSEILKSIPPNLVDLKNIKLNFEEDIFSKISSFLRQQMTRSNLAEEFIIKVKEKQDFIESGLKHLSASKVNNCPFCEQELLAPSIELIKKYNEYLDNEEAKNVKIAKGYIAELDKTLTKFSALYNSYLLQATEFHKYKGYLPSMADIDLSPIEDPAELNSYFDSFKSFILDKIENINLIIEEEKLSVINEKITQWIEGTLETIQANGQVVDIVNQRKNNLQNEKLGLNRRLCIARFLELSELVNNPLKERKELQEKISSLSSSITEKESTQKVNKKEKVIEFFKKFLENFFLTKYQFDETTFCLKLGAHLLDTNAPDVLSDGEKNIVAFCYYLAEVFKLVQTEEDFNRLFFIIDDPISSLDFHYVYAVAQIIRELHIYFNISRLRFILLTHNLEFMSILIRNGIIQFPMILNNNIISPLKNELIMPYEHHLRDILKVSRNEMEVCHTTSNSIRHVLETIQQFISPNQDLLSFCKSIDDFEKSSYLYSLIQDGSHGAIRVQKAYTNQMVIEGCSTVINFISVKFNGQITAISSN